MGNFFDLHRHDEYSFFDGFGKPSELAKVAKDLGYKALGTSNHGNITGLIQHWQACRDAGIKPILGCEVYFQDTFKGVAEGSEKKRPKNYHLCLFVKNMTGYKNLCHMLTEANEKQYYYNPIVDFKLLRKYHDGLICTTACIAGIVSQAIVNKDFEKAEDTLRQFKEIFGNDLYVEVQPYKIDKQGTQQRTNYHLMRLASKNHIKCIVTSDSHYGKKEDFDTYCKMHEIGKTTLDVKNTYSERYMPSEKEIIDRFCRMYRKVTDKPEETIKVLIDNLKVLQDSVEDDILSGCELHLPKYGDGKNSYNALRTMVKNGLKKKGKWNKKYKDRCAFELDVIHYHGFDDYFLMVQDYVNWAREHGIEVGPGRGSACNCLIAYAIGITDVDSIKYKLDFSRFMRKDKKKLPDIDVDFETEYRQEVINYVVNKYHGRAVQICSYGEYSVDNLVNDLSNVCGLPMSGKDLDEYDKIQNKKIIAEIKSHVKSYIIDGKLNIDLLKADARTEEYNSNYDNILKHFCKLYGKVRQLGTHAAGVAVVGTDISDYTAVVKSRGTFNSSFDLNDLEHINCTKFDMLGLKTMSELRELREYTGRDVEESDLEDQKLYDKFGDGETDGIFQMEKSAPKKILKMINCDCMEDVIAVNALNRPAPLQLKMHETYAYNKLSGKIDTSTPYYKYTQETYGTMLYQEQTVEVAQKLGHLSAEQSFDMLKIMKKPENLNKPEYVPVIKQMERDFAKGCEKEGLTKEQTKDVWGSMLIYGFNKGHATGYSLISVKQMFYKIYYPTFFWYVKMKYAGNENDIYKYSNFAVKDGALVMLPHVNYTAKTSVRKMDGEHVIQQGLSIIKGVGEKAALEIENERRGNGHFKSYDDFYDRCKGRTVTKRVIDILDNQGALEFNKNRYYSRVIKYNSALIGRN